MGRADCRFNCLLMFLASAACNSPSRPPSPLWGRSLFKSTGSTDGEASVSAGPLRRRAPGRGVDARDEVARGGGPGGEFELEAGVEQPGGDDAAALEEELGVGTVEERGDLHHP